MKKLLSYKLIPDLTDSQIERFWSNVYSTANKDECWEWHGTIERVGYGTLSINNVDYKAHRISFYIHNKSQYPKLLICHSCDNRKCVNPFHLFVGTHTDNMRDMSKKGRASDGKRLNQYLLDNPDKVQKGEQNYLAKFTNGQILEIRKHDNDCETYDKLAKQYNVNPSTIRKIIKKQTWKHVA